ncbi:bifunctional folylpolyglutamate synthase/dihydrofolate synthase [Bacteroides gallinaceum]|uniref:bifunctional folylpolyglutamate synthase/dihydrofolate synthase n=1 Tax=Bacteroides gallinaceum TaxID=1462571 RepID=UPI0019590431|nr:folylpolyglutamate synthase/dihydrofolate synthase family protein [Bacteroides gallinaceum]MBM6720433.1 bifunctional folylpolyglutamate synthase/dihydrofolate synthase [Bacteroides gallinaceum]
MDYQETLTYLYNSAPLFQQVGSAAYKEGLENTYTLDEYFGHPHRRFRTIHIAGTNGKGSCSHTLAAILQSAGYRVGLYTSPHLVDFRERIRINGTPVSQQFVIEFVEKHRHFFEPLHPSFFELTTAMAFLYFAEQAVDIAVIEVGLGGRLDCTNIIQPDLSLITNISFDHVQFLGNTLAQIAGEKAGIIKPHTPVVIGETTPETKPVFLDKALSVDAPIIFAEEEHLLYNASHEANGNYLYQTADYADLKGELGGLCQEKNTNTLLSALRQLKQTGYRFSETDVRNGFAHVCELTGLQGRWQRLANHPTVICDTGHNVGGIRYIAEQLSRQHYDRLRIVIGMVNDKDIRGVLALLPTDASYYFTQASVKRALPAEEVQKQASAFGLKGNAYPNVKIALKEALAQSSPQDLIFIGGSSFIVADLLATCYTS